MTLRLGVMDPLVPEALVGTIGVLPLLQAGPIEFPESRLEAAAKLPERVKEAARAFVAKPLTGESSRKPVDLDYDEALRMLSAYDAARLDEKLGALDPERGVAFLAAADRAIRYLAGVIPRRPRVGLMWAEPGRPGDTEIARFRREWGVVTDFERVLWELEDGTIGHREVRAARAAYPGLMALLQEELQRAAADRKLEKPDWELGHRRQQVLETVTGVSAIAPELRKRLQRAFDEEIAGMKKTGADSGRKAVSVEQMSTPTQRIEQAT